MRKAAVVSVGRGGGGGRKKPKQIDIYIYTWPQGPVFLDWLLHSYTSALFLSTSSPSSPSPPSPSPFFPFPLTHPPPRTPSTIQHHPFSSRPVLCLFVSPPNIAFSPPHHPCTVCGIKVIFYPPPVLSEKKSPWLVCCVPELLPFRERNLRF